MDRENRLREIDEKYNQSEYIPQRKMSERDFIEYLNDITRYYEKRDMKIVDECVRKIIKENDVIFAIRAADRLDSISNGSYNIDALEEIVLEDGDPMRCLYASKLKGTRPFLREEFKKVILESDHPSAPQANYEYATTIEGADKQEHAQAILKSKDAGYCYLAARDLEVKNVLPFENVVLKSQNAKLCCDFAEDIKGANIEPLKKVVLNKGNANQVKLMSKYAKDDVEKIPYAEAYQKQYNRNISPLDKKNYLTIYDALREVGVKDVLGTEKVYREQQKAKNDMKWKF